MRISTLSTHNFRNLCDQSVDLPGRVTIIIGKNGQGKTSLLEAVYLLGHAKSFRTAKAADLAAWGKDDRPTVIDGAIETADGLKTVSYQLLNGRRSVAVNGKSVTEAGSFYGQLKVIEFTPEDLGLVKGGPSERRAFLDRLLASVDGAYVRNLVLYQRTLKNRNALLAAAEGRDSPGLRAELRHWDVSLAKLGRELAAVRLEAVKRLTSLVGRYYSLISSASGAENPETVEARYRSQIVSEGTLLSEEEVLWQYEHRAAADIARGRTSAGIHRDDIDVIFGTPSVLKTARISASQGQARSLALSLKLSGLEFILERTGDAPILLLDDVESELDLSRQRALFELINGLPNQVLISSTELSETARSTLPELSILSVEKGRISAG